MTGMGEECGMQFKQGKTTTTQEQEIWAWHEGEKRGRRGKGTASFKHKNGQGRSRASNVRLDSGDDEESGGIPPSRTAEVRANEADNILLLLSQRT